MTCFKIDILYKKAYILVFAFLLKNYNTKITYEKIY